MGASVTAVLALGGCHGTAASGVSAPVQGTAAGSATSAAAGCNGDYCTPADWDTAKASTPLTQIPPFVEPLNVVISARSTVSLTQIQQALGTWKTVSTATTVSITGIHLRCISSERADVTGNRYVPQYVAWRFGGCLEGNDLSLSGNEDHVRIWNQPVPGSKYGAWFVAASYETMCLVNNGRLQTASSAVAFAVLHPGAAYHCVDGGPGSIAVAHPDGYDDAARNFTAAVVTAAKSRGWQVSQRTVTAARSASAGEGGVPFSPTVYVLTVTA
ncbi:MAG TPA: hypothetical protein VFO01_16270 [Trebonia sp.]|nr:hypothetical protein [Trebonia sp.]